MTTKKIYPPGAGDVALQLGDHTLILKPTLHAGLAISRTSGGIRGAIDKVATMDFDAIVAVIRVGIGPKEAKRYNLEELVFQNGLMDSQGELLGKVIEFLSNLARGGRPAPADDDAKTDGDDEEGKEPLDPPK